MVRRRIININGTGGDYVAIAATMAIRRMVIRESLVKEDGSAATPQGLTYRVRDDNTAAGFTTVFAVPAVVTDPVLPPIELGSLPTNSAQGDVIGSGPQPTLGGSLDGTHMADVRSATATATAVEVEEYS